MVNSSNTQNDNDGEKPGPGRPPQKWKWKKGGPSPNPKGRPRKSESLVPEFKKIFEAAIFKRVKLPRETGPEYLTKFDIGMEQLANQFAKGDKHARRDVFQFAQLLGVDLKGLGGKLDEALSENHADILEQFLKRRLEPDQAPKDRQMAPPELRDDDADEE